MSAVRHQESSAPWAEANDDRCSFCNGEYPGYALKDKDGVFKPSCWDCAKGGAKSATTTA